VRRTIFEAAQFFFCALRWVFADVLYAAAAALGPQLARNL
jgi:hypothetical protein